MSYEEKTEALTSPSLTNSRLVKVAGLGMAGLLALSACATVGEDDTEEQDQDGANAGEEPADAPEEAPGAEDQVPALEDIEDDIFDAMLNAENVTMTGEGDALDEDFGDFTDGDDEDDEDFDPQDAVFTLAGNIDGSVSQMQFSFGGQEMEFLQTEDQIFLTGETTVFFLEQEMPQDFLSEIDMDAVESELSGTWVDMTDDMGGIEDDFRLDTILSDMREEFQDPDDDSLFPWTSSDYPEGTAEERDGQEVWVYEQDGHEVVVAADQEDPYVLTVDGEDEDGNPVLITFSDWNETDIPETPEGDEVLTPADFESILLDNMA